MTVTLDFTDLPQVEADDLALPMRKLVDSGRGLALLRGLSEDELRDLDQAIWDELGDDPIRRLAAALRFRSLVGVFGVPRLKAMLLQNGFSAITSALRVAAHMRLNVERGFHPYKFARALERELTGHEKTDPALRAA